MNNKFILLTATLLSFLLSGNTAWTSEIIPPDLCSSCHKPEAGMMMGTLKNIALESRMIQIDFTARPEIIKFSRYTALKNLDSFDDIVNYKGGVFKVRFSEINGEKISEELIRLYILDHLEPENKISKDDMKKGLRNPTFKTYDARSLAQFERGHIPGAIPLPAGFFDKFSRNLPKDMATPIVFYDNGDYLSHAAFIKARNLGYSNVRIYAGGYPDWSSTEYVMVASNWLKKAIAENIPHLLIDLRPSEDLVNGHIRGAVNITTRELDRNRSRFPAKKDIPIILYGSDGKDGAAKLISWGHTAVGIITASFDGWQAISNQVETGPASTTMPSVVEAKTETISAKEFYELVALMDDAHLFIDVRNPGELANGVIPGVVNIPLTELGQRLHELPAGKEIILYSNRGIRAEMAHNILQWAKLKSRYLDN